MAGRAILTVAGMAAADRAAIENGTPGIELMERAGAAVVDAVIARFAPSPAVVLVGPGNNGGDGYVVARLLKELGWNVKVAALGPPKTPDAQAAAGRWHGATSPISGEVLSCGLIIDGLFGAGLDRPLSSDLARLARSLKPLRNKIVAIDVPSGLAGDTGRPLAGECFPACLTVTFHRRKPAHVLQPGRDLCGEVVVADIGLGDVSSDIFENDPALWLDRYPWPGWSADPGMVFSLSPTAGISKISPPLLIPTPLQWV